MLTPPLWPQWISVREPTEDWCTMGLEMSVPQVAAKLGCGRCKDKRVHMTRIGYRRLVAHAQESSKASVLQRTDQIADLISHDFSR